MVSTDFCNLLSVHWNPCFFLIQAVDYSGQFSALPTAAGISTKEMEPVWWLFYYVTAVGIALLGCNYVEYWAFIRLIGGFSFIMLVIYILGSFASVDYNRYASADKYNFETEFYMLRIFNSAGMFRGVQFLPLISMKVNDVSACFISISFLLFLILILIFLSD